MNRTDPRMLGSFVTSIRPISHCSIFVTGSKVYFPWLATREQFRTHFGIQTSKETPETTSTNLIVIQTHLPTNLFDYKPSKVLPNVCLGPTVISNFPWSPAALNNKLWRTYIGIATTLCEPIWYESSLKFPSGGMNDKILSD